MSIRSLQTRQLLNLFLLPSVISAALIFFWQQFGFLTAHLVSEIAGIVLASAAFIVGALLQGFLRTQALSTLATAFGWAAILSLLHALTYPGMGLLPIDEQSVSGALGLSARWLEAMAFMLAGMHHRRVLPPWIVHISFAVLTSALALSAFTDWLPSLYSDLLTPSFFKVGVELFIITILIREVFLIWHRSKGLSELRLDLTIALLFFISAETINLFYQDAFGIPVLISQSLNLFVYWLVYQTIVKTSLIDPYDRLAHVSKVYDAVIDPTLIVDREGLIKKANVAAGRVLGVSPDLLIGKSSHVLFHNTEADQNDCEVCRSLKEGASLDRYEITRKHGSSLLQVSINRVDESDDADLYVEVLHDQSEVARLRQDLSQSANIVAQQRAALEALAKLKTDEFDLTAWLPTLSTIFRAPHLVHLYLNKSPLEIGAPPAKNMAMLTAPLGDEASRDQLIAYYPESPDLVAGGFDPIERMLFEMIGSALRAKLNSSP